MTGKGLAHLASLQHLHELSFQGSDICDSGLKEIGKLTRLSRLDLGWTRVSDAAIEHLKKLTTAEHALSFLNVGDSDVSEDGVKRLREAMPGCAIQNGT